MLQQTCVLIHNIILMVNNWYFKYDLRIYFLCFLVSGLMCYLLRYIFLEVPLVCSFAATGYFPLQYPVWSVIKRCLLNLCPGRAWDDCSSLRAPALAAVVYLFDQSPLFKNFILTTRLSCEIISLGEIAWDVRKNVRADYIQFNWFQCVIALYLLLVGFISLFSFS